ncbi:MAG: phosphoribosylaminoimidazolesuccinocarboxamide synthase [Spirochaetales bacterium]|nr:phosphoribosylaminoimidazolesuccinocarboxamide synthase [Leptospiraceae bacterium]MCP5480804.1 phosphoribosylaminoimidazolesuccinocarboxamide synthase [Spirochaetales bacterium]
MVNLPEPDYRGKVRDLFFIDRERMLVRASDRLSAFDVVFGQPIPDKGRILTRVSNLWFEALRKSGLQQEFEFEDHLLETADDRLPEPFCNHPDFVGRSVLVRRTERVDFECVVRGYLAGSGWKDYQRSGAVCGHSLPEGLRQADLLPEPIFTPATKAALGDHDENVSTEYMVAKLGQRRTDRLREISIAIFNFASQRMQSAGILLCDTKFEFGIRNDRIVLIDEALTPDSSRYWDQSTYEPGTSPPGFDKQFVRDYVEQLGWNKKPPAPQLPDDVIQKTRGLYEEIERRIEGALGI